MASGPFVFVLSKAGTFLFTVFLTSLLVFFSRFVLPDDPARFRLSGRSPSPEALTEIKKQFNLDRPPFEQYLAWVGGILHGD